LELPHAEFAYNRLHPMLLSTLPLVCARREPFYTLWLAAFA